MTNFPGHGPGKLLSFDVSTVTYSDSEVDENPGRLTNQVFSPLILLMLMRTKFSPLIKLFLLVPGFPLLRQGIKSISIFQV